MKNAALIIIDGKQVEIQFQDSLLRDYFAAHERLTDWDSENATMHPDYASALAGEPSPRKENYQNEKEYAIAFLRWEAKWRAAFKYIRADAMLAARKESLAKQQLPRAEVRHPVEFENTDIGEEG